MEGGTMACKTCCRKIKEHVVSEGSREHVMHWDTNGRHCSEKDCEVNHGKGKCAPASALREKNE